MEQLQLVVIPFCQIWPPPFTISQGWKKPNFFWPMYWVFGFNVKDPIFVNKTMDLFQHSAFGSWHHHWWTLGPLPYNLNLFVIKPK
jgi:hypothetical protein